LPGQEGNEVKQDTRAPARLAPALEASQKLLLAPRCKTLAVFGYHFSSFPILNRASQQKYSMIAEL
jgi:hypothetical protein